ncbi:MAG: dihydrofolate reductase [Polyangiaceae bacterium]|nr:dihydrofolate reductase [Polyangiaceae bacterium]MCE7888825.1 dihydrofolate reductase [Sorangiineae bacterium PRO1]MCL4751292.1 dihydrofolate reductase [Myxococcales bacterium]
MSLLQAILAVADNGVIGSAGRLPWDHPEDREHFRLTTWGHAVLMGRRTWEEVGSALPGRENVVLSSRLVAPAGARVATSLDAALELAFALDPEPFVIGGAALFAAAWPRVRRVYLTRIPGAPPGDTRFEPDLAGFRLLEERAGLAGLRYLVLERA